MNIILLGYCFDHRYLERTKSECVKALYRVSELEEMIDDLNAMTRHRRDDFMS